MGNLFLSVYQNQWPNFFACQPTVRVSPKNVGEEQKKVFTFSDVLFSPKNSGAPREGLGSTPPLLK